MQNTLYPRWGKHPGALTNNAIGGCYNLKEGRAAVRGGVEQGANEALLLLFDHDLDFVTLSEAEQYVGTIQHKLKGTGAHLFTDDRPGAGRDSVVLLRKGLRGRRMRVHDMGGVQWERRPGRPGLHRSRMMCSVEAEGFGRIGALHTPPGPFGPSYPLRRKANLVAFNKAALLGRQWTKKGDLWVLPGDLNRRKTDPVVEAFAHVCDARIYGEGIDLLAAGPRVFCEYIDEPRGDWGSDHDPRVFSLRWKDAA